MRIVITGANRGLGLEFVRRYLARGDHVDAGVRHPESASELSALAASSGGRLRIFACDIGSEGSVRAFAESIGDVAVDVLINNAGIFGTWDNFENLDFPNLMRVFETNTVGTLRVTRALLGNLRRGSGRKIVNISSKVGSIDDNTSGGGYGYRISKVAMNMASKSLALELRGDGITVLIVHPGWVQTDMGGRNAPTTIEESVASMMKQIDLRGIAESGTFFDFTGKTLPW